MARRRIGLAPGSIMPTAHELWGEAVERLDEAAKGIALMRQASNRIVFSSGWKQCVDALEQSWTYFFAEGERSFSDFQPWAGRIDAKRKKDPLLRYLIEARHQSQHGGSAIEWTAPVLRIAPGFNGAVHRIQIFGDGTYEMQAKPLQPWMPQATVDHSPSSPVLATIINKRYPDQMFPPPTPERVGAGEDVSPVAVALAGHGFYSNVIKDARAKFDTGSKGTSV